MTAKAKQTPKVLRRNPVRKTAMSAIDARKRLFVVEVNQATARMTLAVGIIVALPQDLLSRLFRDCLLIAPDRAVVGRIEGAVVEERVVHLVAVITNTQSMAALAMGRFPTCKVAKSGRHPALRLIPATDKEAGGRTFVLRRADGSAEHRYFCAPRPTSRPTVEMSGDST
jgi:hypothetical protein